MKYFGIDNCHIKGLIMCYSFVKLLQWCVLWKCSYSVSGPVDLERHIVEECEPRDICSAFAALSGHTDRRLYSHYSKISNIRHQV